MNKILYFTTAQDSISFCNELKHYLKSPNLSNQNFHNKLIRCLSITHEINVISNRPISNYHKTFLDKKTYSEKNITWHYLKVSTSKFDKYFNINKRVNEIVKNIDMTNTTIFVDVLNLSLFL